MQRSRHNNPKTDFYSTLFNSSIPRFFRSARDFFFCFRAGAANGNGEVERAITKIYR